MRCLDILLRRIISIPILLACVWLAPAQTVLDLSQYRSVQNVKLKMTVQDADTREPMPNVTVYLVPQGDTTITHFSMTGPEGFAAISDILPGVYLVNAEILGYKPYSHSHKLQGPEVNLGSIYLEENTEIIDAASITAIASPVVVKRDTLEYNAMAFRVGEGAMLEDLLKKMPGMEVDADGTVRVNGEEVEKITVGGKTFFLNNPAMAVKNLPAKVVEKIKVIDKTKDEAQYAGVVTKDDKEKVMDLQLKEEYRKGWFGNTALSAGSTIGSRSDDDLSDNVGAVFNGNAMLAGYNDTDQLTVLGSGRNAEDPGTERIVYNISGGDGFDDELSRSIDGLATNAQAGVNYNTTRIGGMESSAGISYGYGDRYLKRKSHKTTFRQDGGDLNADGDYSGFGRDNRIGASLRLNNTDTRKFLVNITPSFSFISRSRETADSTGTFSSGERLNKSSVSAASKSDVFRTVTGWTAGIKDMGKNGRNLMFSGNFQYSRLMGDSRERTVTESFSSLEYTDLRYDTKAKYMATEGILTYVEPIGGNWALQGRFTACYINKGRDRKAFNGIDGSVNDSFTSVSSDSELLFRERLLLQYSEGQDLKLIFGGMFDQDRNVVSAEAMGVRNTSGKDRWLLFFSPHAEVNWEKDNMYLNVECRGNSSSPSGMDIMPALEISSPAYASTGNIYLKPSFMRWMEAEFNISNPERHSTLDLYASVNIESKKIVSANWHDEAGIRYSFPVNSRKPSAFTYLYCSYTLPFSESGKWTFSTTCDLSYDGNESYQASHSMPGLDKDSFRYDDVMSRLWGDESGNRFYSGESGFSESLSNTLWYTLSARFSYKGETFSASFRPWVRNTVSRYSLDPSANMNIWEISAKGEVLYQPDNGWELGTDCGYTLYRGYSSGFGSPEFIWNARISRTVKSITFSLKLADILNRRLSVQRVSSSDYMIDSRTNVMGRYFLAGITFNFGKMNARNNSKAQAAVRDMFGL